MFQSNCHKSSIPLVKFPNFKTLIPKLNLLSSINQSSSYRSMSRRTVGSSRHAIENCIFKLHSWRPFHLPTPFNKTLEKPDNTSANNPTSCCKPHKRPCFSDRATSFSIENLDMSKLSLFDDDVSRSSFKLKRERMHWMARKRRRRGSRSVSGRSSDQSGTRRSGGRTVNEPSVQRT